MTNWYFYLTGVALALIYKWVRYAIVQRPLTQTIGEATTEWFFETSTTNVVSWSGTILNVLGSLVIGAVYIDKVGIGLDWFQAIPVHWALCLFLGYIGEFLVPNLVKWVASKIPGGDQ